ncbi:MFS general substrate transporter [Sparassis latifolia]
MSDVVDEKKLRDAEMEVSAIPVDKEDFASAISDGDDALKVVGTQRTHTFDKEYNRKLRRKIDLLIPPLCAAVYFTQFLDKNILNYASIMGLPIKGIDFNNVAMAFYLGFMVWQFPTQYIAQKFPIAKYLGVNVTLWGVVVILHSTAPKFSGFYACRFILGMLECCVAPILILIISMWYKKNEQASRISYFYLMNGLTSIFGGFIAYGLTFYEGGIPQWKLIYIILGALAIIVGICVLIWMPDSPVTARFLTEEERIAALERVRDDQAGTHNKHIKKYQIYESLKDVRTWFIFLIVMCIGLPNGAMSSFGNLVMKSFGFTSRQALLLGTPSGLISAVTVIVFGYWSDFINDRMTLITLSMVPNLIGMALMTAFQKSGNKGVLLFSIYIQGFSGPCFPLVYAWNASNTSGHTKKVTLNAITLFTFGLGNVVGSYLFLPADAPNYIPGKIAIVVLIAITMVACIVLRFINLHMNKNKKRALDAAIAANNWTEEDVQREREKAAFLDMTDKE